MPIKAPATEAHTIDRHALFALHGPIDPHFVTEAVRTLLRALPLDTGEPQPWIDRRMTSALDALAGLFPRDEAELMLAVQAIAAYHAAAAAWHLGMNHHLPRGDSTRHISAANASARTFDSLLKAIERRQAKPLSPPPGYPDGRPPCTRPSNVLDDLGRRATGAGEKPEDTRPVNWSLHEVAEAEKLRAAEEYAEDYKDLDLANTPGILPNGGIIVPEDPTPAQTAYMARRYALNMRAEYRATLSAGQTTLPKITPVRVGDLIP